MREVAMDKTTVTKFRWFWAWQDEKEEAWLGEMSGKGYHLAEVGFPGLYRFISEQPRHYVYRLDYQPGFKKDRDDYLQIFSDAGWEHIGEMSAWQYFRKEAAPGEQPEIFTDNESKVTKYKRLLGYLGIFLAPLWTLLILQVSESPYTWVKGIQIFILAVSLFFLYAGIRILLRIRQLRSL
jgi:hypothetical protein